MFSRDIDAEAIQQKLLELQETQAYILSLFRILPFPLAVIGLDTAVVRESHSSAIFAQTALGIRGDGNWREAVLYYPGTKTLIPVEDQPAARALRGETVMDYECTLIKKDGTEMPALFYAAPVWVHDEIIGAVLTCFDITKVKEADRAKDEFLSVLSHELRTPLAVTLGWTEVAERARDPQKQARALASAKESIFRQRDMLSDLLDISRLIHQKLEIARGPAELWALITEGVAAVQPNADSRGVNITLHRAAGPLPVSADPQRICQVAKILLVHMLHHCPAGGTITVTGRHQGDSAVLTFADDGDGIAPEELPDIFTPFRTQGKDPTGGLGLGLALAKGLIELHHGTLTASSPGRGQGSTFMVSLPLLT